MTVCRYPGDSRDPTARRSLQYRHPGNGRESSTPHHLQCRHRSEGRHPSPRHQPSYRFIPTSRAPTPSSWLRPEFLHTPPALIPFPSTPRAPTPSSRRRPGSICTLAAIINYLHRANHHSPPIGRYFPIHLGLSISHHSSTPRQSPAVTFSMQTARFFLSNCLWECIISTA